MDELKKRMIHLHHCRGIGPQSIIRLLKYKSNLSNLYQLSLHHLKSIFRNLPTDVSTLYFDLHHLPIDNILLNYKYHNIHCLTIFDKEYPYSLKQIHNPPIVLYYTGNISLLKQPAIAIVGSRKANHYAKKAIHHLIPPLIDKGVSIVSGLAKGVDAMAHQAAIIQRGKTIGVLGSGFFHIYPQENRGLAENMKRDHLLLSEYPPNIRAQKWHFPMRNRIINGLSKGTLVIQAEERSGSLITAEYALQEGREVFSVPGPLDDPLSKGTNFLIQQGAKLVLDGKDILEELNL